jgi:hypothetical protein
MTTPAQTGAQLAGLADRAVSVAQMLFDRIAQTPDREAFRYPVGDRWVSRTWRQSAEQVTRLAAGLVALGSDGWLATGGGQLPRSARFPLHRVSVRGIGYIDRFRVLPEGSSDARREFVRAEGEWPDPAELGGQ